MLCSGITPERMGEILHITRKTVYNHIDTLYANFHVKSREEMVAMAWELDIVTKNDIRFYDRKKPDENMVLPEWSVIKKKADEKLKEFNTREEL
jgi:hypothetical protein